MNFLLQAGEIGEMVFEPRVPNTSFWAMLVFFGGAIVIAVARAVQRDVFVVLMKSTLFMKTNEELSKDGEGLAPLSSILLLIQFFAIFSYILFSKFDTGFGTIVPHLALPVYLLYLVITTWLLTRLTNNDVLFREIQHFTFVLAQVFGLLYLIMVFVDYYTPFIPKNETILLLTPIALLFAFRMLRCTVLALRQKMRWYYIILYFWTLEILPVLALVKLLFPVWFRDWIA